MQQNGVTKDEAIAIYKKQHCTIPPQKYCMYTKYHPIFLKWNKLQEAVWLLNRGCYYSASIIAFTLPEVCGQADRRNYPQDYLGIKESDGKSIYIRWFDKYVTPNFGTLTTDPQRSPICMNGYLAYKLRCQLVHRRTQKLEDSPNDKTSRWMNEYDNVKLIFTHAEITEVIIDSGANTICFKIGLLQLCRQLILCEEETYEQAEDKTIFLNDIEET